MWGQSQWNTNLWNGINNNRGDQLTDSQVAAIFSADVDKGHTSDGIIYGGTLQGDVPGGPIVRVGIVRPNPGLGDALFPTLRAGESNTYCRAQISDFTYTPHDGDRVKFIIVRTSAGDRMAKAVSTL